MRSLRWRFEAEQGTHVLSTLQICSINRMNRFEGSYIIEIDSRGPWYNRNRGRVGSNSIQYIFCSRLTKPTWTRQCKAMSRDGKTEGLPQVQGYAGAPCTWSVRGTASTDTRRPCAQRPRTRRPRSQQGPRTRKLERQRRASWW